MNERNIGLDVLRIVSVLVIFMFHSGAEYGVLSDFISLGSVFMIAFFMLSGYVMYICYSHVNLMRIDEIKIFWFKRMARLLPIYWLMIIVYILLYNRETLKEAIVRLPLDLLGINGTFAPSINGIGGTWFVSCFVFCYILYPFFQELVKQMSGKGKCKLLLLILIVLFWVPLVETKFGLKIVYTSIFYRGLQFLVGIILASEKEYLEQMLPQFFFTWKVFFIELIVLICGMTYFRFKYNLFFLHAILSVWLPVFVFVLMIISVSGINAKNLEKWRWLRYLSESSYMIFFAQLYCFDITDWIMAQLKLDHNIIKIMLSFVVGGILAFILYEGIDKRIYRIIREYSKMLQHKVENNK